MVSYANIVYPTEQGKGIEGPNRLLLDTLHGKMTGPFSALEASELLLLDLSNTRRRLSYLAARGWLSRVRQGLYTLVPLGATSPSMWREDPWVAAAKTFVPGYIGGWSACEHWGLTEQIFRDVVVITAATVRCKLVTIQDTIFRVKHVADTKIFGTRIVWRGQTKVQVSDPSRTIIDVLNDPSLGGGIRHVAEIVETYFASDDRDDAVIITYAIRLGNRTVFKRLGFLIEELRIDAADLMTQCLALKSNGLSLLDPSGSRNGRIIKRWELRVNARIAARHPS